MPYARHCFHKSVTCCSFGRNATAYTPNWTLHLTNAPTARGQAGGGSRTGPRGRAGGGDADQSGGEGVSGGSVQGPEPPNITSWPQDINMCPQNLQDWKQTRHFVALRKYQNANAPEMPYVFSQKLMKLDDFGQKLMT